ncbi:MAG: hypothetical protein L6R41_008039 [Letrouitia leprolyta]|nr:MAG: hypothetical protein L6R41_008039 [Letrouitia leprolyta]
MSPLLFALLFFLNNALASPLTVVSPFSVISSHTSNATSSSIKGRPSLPPKCILRLGPSREQYGKIDYDSCDRAIAKIPREPRNHPVLRNFYVKTEDRSMTMPNMEIPVVEIEGNCIVEVLLSSSFEDVPHDQAIWQDLWGPARLILNYCVSARRTGGIIDGIGRSNLPFFTVVSASLSLSHTQSSLPLSTAISLLPPSISPHPSKPLSPNPTANRN